MVELLIISTLIIAIAVIFLCIKLFFSPDGKISSMHIHDSEAMRERGIKCVIDMDREMREKGRG